MADTLALIGTELKTFPGAYFGGTVYGYIINDADNDSVAVIFQAPEACDITGMTAHCQWVEGTSPFHKFQLQGVDASGDPDGVNLAETAEFQAGGVGNEAHAFTSAYTCTQGELLCGRISYSSGTVDGSNNCDWVYATRGVPYNLVPYVAYVNPAGSWASINSYYPTFALQTDITDLDIGGVYNIGGGSSARHFLNTGGDRYAQRVEIPASESLELHVDGFRFCGSVENVAGGNFIAGIWPESGAALASVTIDSAQQPVQSSTSPTSRAVMFTQTATMTSGSVFYIGFEHTGGGSGDNLMVQYAKPDSADGLKSWPGGDAFYASDYDAGTTTWTDDVTKRLMLNPILTSIHGTGGGGSTTRPTMGVIG